MRGGCRLGLDSHADMSCIGKHGRILETIVGQSCTVHPYKPISDVKTVNAAFAYDTKDGDTYIIKVNKALDFTNTMEARNNIVQVDYIPRSIDITRRSTH